MQPVFHARIAAERDDGTGYTIDDVADGIAAKLVRRHPHVFGDVTVSGADEVTQNWDEIKKREKADQAERSGVPAAGQPAPSALDGVPFGQPALALAAALQRRAARAGVPEELTLPAAEPHAGARDDADGRDEAEAPGDAEAPDDAEGRDDADGPDDAGSPDIGRELFRLVAQARALGLDPEAELRAAARRYGDLVRAWERSRPPADR
jgi:XTP/dITP diphosphohydrolase